MSKPAKARADERGGRGYALSSVFPAMQHLRTALDSASSVSISALGLTLRDCMSSDLYRIKRHENVEQTDLAAKIWLMRYAAEQIDGGLDINGDMISLKPGVTPNDLRYEGRPVQAFGRGPNDVLKSPFDLLTSGTFVEDIRAKGKDDLSELRWSMKTFGWLEHHPAILDEHGVVIVGHRRLAVAKELNIERREGKEFVKIPFGTGDPADAKRVSLALASNLGGKPLNAADRKRVAERLYGNGGWTIESIASVLGEATSNIARDLDGYNPEGIFPERENYTSGSKRRGRRKGSKTGGGKRPNASQQEAAQKAARRVLDEGLSTEAAAKQEGVPRLAAREALAREEGSREAVARVSEPRDDDPLRIWLIKALADAPVPLSASAAQEIASGLTAAATAWKLRLEPRQKGRKTDRLVVETPPAIP